MKEANLELINKDTILEQLTESNKYCNDKVTIIKNSKTNKIRAEYNNSYIGIISDSLSTREEIGMYCYQGRKSHFEWYYGEWKNNVKEGLGLIQLGNDEFYFGQWKEGKFEGKGIYFWLFNFHLDKLSQETNYTELEYQVFIGDFINNEKRNGFYLMNELEGRTVGYVGKIDNNHKNDSDALLIEFNNQRVYKGRIENDEMIDGYYSHYNYNNGVLSSDSLFRFIKKDDGGHQFVMKNKIKDNQGIQEDILNKVRDVIKTSNNFEALLKQLIEMIILQYERLVVLDYYSEPELHLKELTDLFSTFNIQ